MVLAGAGRAFVAMKSRTRVVAGLTFMFSMYGCAVILCLCPFHP